MRQTVQQRIALLYSFVFSLLLIKVSGCAPPGFVPSQDPAHINVRCSDLTLYPMNAIDQSQFRYDYGDESFGNTHSQGSTATITCTINGKPGLVRGYDQQQKLIDSLLPQTAFVATCTNVGGSQYTWTHLTSIIQYIDCH